MGRALLAYFGDTLGGSIFRPVVCSCNMGQMVMMEKILLSNLRWLILGPTDMGFLGHIPILVSLKIKIFDISADGGRISLFQTSVHLTVNTD